jgi:hypothetical protein
VKATAGKAKAKRKLPELDEVTTDRRPPKPAISIVSILPRYCDADVECDVAIQFFPENVRVGYCRFGDRIVQGSIKSDQMLHCRAPRHPPGPVRLSISGDGEKFFGGVIFTFEKKGWVSLWALAVPGFVVTALIAVSCITRRRLPTRRRKDGAAPLLGGNSQKAKPRVVNRRQPPESV